MAKYKSIFLSIFFLLTSSFLAYGWGGPSYCDSATNTFRQTISFSDKIAGYNWNNNQRSYSARDAFDSNRALYRKGNGYFAVAARPEHNMWNNQLANENLAREYNQHRIAEEEANKKAEADKKAKENAAKLGESARSKQAKRKKEYKQETRKALEDSRAYLENYTAHCRAQIAGDAINSGHKVRLQERADAIEQSKSNFFSPILENYTLSSQTQQLMKESNTETDIFSECYGSLIQQQIHKEVIDIVGKAGANYVYSRQNQPTKIVSQTIGQLAGIAVEHNGYGGNRFFCW